MWGMVFVVVTGTPGVGKTVFSKALAEALGFGYLDVGELCVREGYVAGYDRERGSYIADTDRLRRRLSRLKGGDYVLDGHISHLAAPPELVRVVYVLRCHPEVLRRRLEARGYPPSKVRENVMAELLDVCLVEALELHDGRVCELDSTGKSVEQLVSEALTVYRGEVKPKTGVVDWVSKLQQEGLLEKLLMEAV